MDSPTTAEEVFKRLLEEILTEIVFQVEIEQHFEQSIQTQLKMYMNEEKLLSTTLDVFSGSHMKELHECVCPNCGRTVGAIRFAPHLEKCVGMGRSSSRIASQRILASSNSGKELRNVEDIAETNGGSQSQYNAEWTPRNTRQIVPRRKKDRSGKHYRKKRKFDDLYYDGGDGNDDYKFNNMNLEEKEDILSRMCGVVSEHTGRLCTRSVRCPNHSDEQRNNVRLTFLPSEGIQSDFSEMSVQDDMRNIDIEIIEIEEDISYSPINNSEKHYRLK